MQIRKAIPEDYINIERLLLESNSHHTKLEPELIRKVSTYLPRQDYISVLDDSQQDFLVLEVENFILGTTWVIERKHKGGQAIIIPVAFILEFCIDDNSRRQGLGSTLMGGIESWAKQRNLKYIEFNVWSENKSAVSFYEKLGFRYTRHEMLKSVI